MPDGPMPTDQKAFEAMVRRYAAKLLRRYSPLIIGAVLLLLMLLLLPTTQPLARSGTDGGPAPGTGNVAAAPGPAAHGSAGAPGVGNADSGANPGVEGATAGAPGAGAGGGIGAPLAFSAAAGSASGMAKTGVRCGGGARQFAWSVHSPNCEAAFTANNGGNTGQGVTASTITLTFRVPNSAQDQAIAAAAGAANVNYPAMLADFQTYINFFNTQFELYGRHVMLKAYNGQGDYIQEDQGQNLAAAQADAVSAHDMGAFGDVTFSLGSSQAYEQDLADEHVMSFSSIAQPESWFQQYAPYEWSVQGPSGTTAVQEAAAVVCRRMAGMPAIFSGDALSTHTTRVFGLVYPEIPTYTALANQYKQLLRQQCGQDVAETSAYAVNVSQFPSQATTIVAQMRAAHVTSILCACDPVFPVFLSRAASGQNYHPEWVVTEEGDPSGRLYDQSEWGHAFGGGLQFPTLATTEAARAYQLANPGHQPAEGSGSGGPPYFYVPYYTLLHVFEALQAAGPALTAKNFAGAMFSLPPSVGADPVGGEWQFGDQVYDPVVSFSLAWWNPNATSAFDNKTGAYQACNGGQVYTASNLAALGGPKQQLNCLGR